MPAAGRRAFVFELTVLGVANSLRQFILVFPWVYISGVYLLGRLTQVLFSFPFPLL